jgi:RNA polymerase sigma-70 factor, ECF subfamily
LSDQELLRRAQAGDASAWDALYERYLPVVWRYVYVRVAGDQHLAEDIVAETMLSFVHDLSRIDPTRGTVPGWLLGVARHKLGDHRRRVARAGPAGDVSLEHETSGPAAQDAASLYELSETRERILAVMDRLPDEERLVLEWKYLDGLQVREMASRLGRTEKAVESILYRARRSFRSMFERVAERGEE